MMARDTPRPDTVSRWQDEALCKTRPDLNWFPSRGEQFNEQRAVCAACPARIDCLAAALDVNGHDDFGIWGGTSERQRRIMRSERNTTNPRGVAVCGTRSGYVRHVRCHEKTCDPCKAANAAYQAQRKNADQ